MWEEAEAAGGRQSWGQPWPVRAHGHAVSSGPMDTCLSPGSVHKPPKPLTFLPARFPGTHQQAKAAASPVSARLGQELSEPSGTPWPRALPECARRAKLDTSINKTKHKLCLKGKQMPDRCVPNSHCDHRSAAQCLVRASCQGRSDGPTAQGLWSQADEACPGWSPSFPWEGCVTVGMSPDLSEPAEENRHTHCAGFVNRSQGCHTGPGV